MGQQLVDDNGVTDVTDDDGITSFIDDDGNWLGDTPTDITTILLGDRVLDAGLIKLDSEANRIYLCTDLPTSYTDATSTFALGFKDLGTGNVFGAPAADPTPGRAVVSVPFSGGSISTSGTATHWAAVDSAGSQLLAAGTLAGAVAVLAGQTFALPAITVGLPNS